MKLEQVIVAALRGAADGIEALCAEPTADPQPYGPSSVASSSPSEPAAGATFHTRVAEALGLYDGDNGSYIYADEERCLEEIAKNAREGELWRAHVRVLDEASDGLEEPEACGCEESDDLKARLRDIHTECQLAPGHKSYAAALDAIRELSRP